MKRLEQQRPCAVKMAEHVYGLLRCAGVVYQLEEPETTIGRGEECSLVLEGRGVSRVHARLRLVKHVIIIYGQRSKPLVRKFRQTFHFCSVICFYLFV